MILSGFKYFIFELLDFYSFYNAFEANFRSIAKSQVRSFYDGWLDGFLHKAGIFYHAQYARHENYVLREFSLNFNIPLDASPSEYGLGEEWEEKRYDSGLNAHYDDWQYQHQSINSLRRELGGEDAFKQIENWAKHDDVDLPTYKQINTLWFNSVISNSPEKIAELKGLPYKESYLRTRV